MKKLTFQRKELYEKVWSEPISYLVKEMGISSHQFYKVCRELNVPTPSSGYWAKLRHGKDVTKPELPESDKESFTLTVEGKPKTSKDPEKSVPTIVVPKKLTRPHPLVKQALKDINKKSLNRFNRVRGGRPLDISVAPENVDRGLRIIDTIIKEVEKRGYSVHTYLDNSSYWMYIKVDQERIYFQLREEGKRRKRKDEEKEYSWEYEYEYTPTGQLKLSLFENKWHWTGRVISDTKYKKLEDRIDEFFYKFDLKTEELKKERLEREERHRQQEAEQRIKEEAKKQHKEETERLRQLEHMAKTYTISQYIYDFVDEIEHHQDQLDLTEKEKLKFRAWIIWARKHADRLNPVKKVVKVILND